MGRRKNFRENISKKTLTLRVPAFRGMFKAFSHLVFISINYY